jgi:hypothetical protein
VESETTQKYCFGGQKVNPPKVCPPSIFVILTFVVAITTGISSQYLDYDLIRKYVTDSTSLEPLLDHPRLGAVEYG